MRKWLFLFLLSLATGCEPCLDYPNQACIALEAGGAQEAGNNQVGNGPVATFMWSRNGEALADQTQLVSLRAFCVDSVGSFVFIADSLNYEGDTLAELKGITLSITYENHPETARCFVLLRQNENETPLEPAPPGTAIYTIGNVERAAQAVEAGQFTGFWQVDIP